MSGRLLDRLRHVLGLLGAAIIATAVSGIGGTLGFALFHGATASMFVTWQNWFASDALGIITIAPLIIGLASATREPPARNETIEGLVAAEWPNPQAKLRWSPSPYGWILNGMSSALLDNRQHARLRRDSATVGEIPAIALASIC